MSSSTVVVLGAGATRGASFVDPLKNACLPPLDTDFFTQLQRVRNPKHKKLIDDVLGDAHELFGVNFTLTLETMFTTIEQTIRMVKATRESREWKTAELENKRARLMQAIGAVLEESLLRREGDQMTRDHEDCEHHRKLIEHLQPEDAILSFNYDCLVDHMLRKDGSGKWNARYGYGFDLGQRGRLLEGDKRWQPEKPALKEKTVRLYKLHGSLHFQIAEKVVQGRDEAYVVLKERPYTKQHGSLKFTIIPPEWNKQYDRGVFARVWMLASAAIHKAEHLIFIGYSLPATDMHSTVLFRTSVKKEGLKSLVIVNPDHEARRRTRDVVQRGISKSTRVLSFDFFREFAAADGRLWRGLRK
jgi:hypothetical protein